MKPASCDWKETSMVKTGWLTALINSLFCASMAAATDDPAAAGDQQPLRYGPFDIRPRIGAALHYDDNIYINSTNRQSDAIWSFTPGVLFGAGDYRKAEENWMTLDYMPSFIVFTQNSRNNAIDHDGRLGLQQRSGPMTFTLQQDVQVFSGSVADVGSRVNRNIYTTEAGASYEISPKTSVEITARQQFNQYKSFVDFNEWVVGGGVDYWLTPKIRIGAAINGGWLDVQRSANQQYQQLQGRIAYTLTDKVELRASLGVELRHFDGGKDRAYAIFSLGGVFKPVENTSLTLDAYRRNQNSIVLVNQNYTTTGVSGGVQHTFKEKYTAHLTGGYENADYNATVAAVAGAARNDDYGYVRVGLDAKIIERVTAGVFYQYRRNSSSLPGFGFDNNQVGVNVAFSY